MRKVFISLQSIVLFLLVSQTMAGSDYTTEEVWEYSLLSSFSVGVLGFLCSGLVIIFKKFTKVNFIPALKVLIGFASGALIGDSFVHLLPEGFGQEHHEEEHHSEEENMNQSEHNEQEQEHKEEETAPNAQLLSLMLIAGLLSFFVVEKFMSLFGIASHSHEQQIEKEELLPENAQKNQVTAAAIAVGEININKAIETDQKQNQQNIEQDPQTTDTNQIEKLPQKGCCQSLKNKHIEGYLNLIGDFIHNILDGIAIGAVFASGNKEAAISTVIAIIAHEIPQEIGDVSVLLHSKFTYMQALACNTFVNFSALIGCIIGAAIGELDELSSKYLYLFIAGNFIYLGCVDMLPLITQERNRKIAVMQFLALSLGFGVMYLTLLSEGEGHSH